MKVVWNQHTRESSSTWNTDVTQRQQQRPESPAVPLSHGTRVNARYTNSTRGTSSILSEIRLHSDSQAATFQLSQSKPGIPGPYTFLTFAKAVVNLYLQKLGVWSCSVRHEIFTESVWCDTVNTIIRVLSECRFKKACQILFMLLPFWKEIGKYENTPTQFVQFAWD